MLTHAQILSELIRQLDAKTIKPMDVARHLGVMPARITDIRAGRRRIQPEEMDKVATLLGMSSPQLAPIKLYDVARRILELDGMPEAKAAFLAEVIEESSRLLAELQSDSGGQDVENNLHAATRAVWNLKQTSKP